MHVNATGWVEVKTGQVTTGQALTNRVDFDHVKPAHSALSQVTPIICYQPSPHFDQRPAETEINLLVIHNISLPPGEFGGGYVQQLFAGTIDLDAHAWFENLKDVRVSAHFLIERNGCITQFVSCLDRAWHAGVSTFDGRTQCNDFSIGIELEGTDDLPYNDQQYKAVALLTDALRNAFPFKAVRGHCHIAPVRKTDPGVSFDWSRYASDANWPADTLPKIKR